MLAKAVAALALVASASAYAPTMSLSANRRELVQGAAAAAVVTPLLRPTGASASDKLLRAPVVEIFDSRGCEVTSHREYFFNNGAASNDMNDQQCVKVSMQPIKVSEATAAKYRQQFIGFKQSSINVEQISTTEAQY